MASAHTLLSQVISNNYGGVSVLPNTKVSYVNLLQGRGDTRFNFIFVKKVNCNCTLHKECFACNTSLSP